MKNEELINKLIEGKTWFMVSLHILEPNRIQGNNNNKKEWDI